MKQLSVTVCPVDTPPATNPLPRRAFTAMSTPLNTSDCLPKFADCVTTLSAAPKRVGTMSYSPQIGIALLSPSRSSLGVVKQNDVKSAGVTATLLNTVKLPYHRRK